MNELNIERKKERQIISRKKELMQSLIDKVKEGWKKERNRSNNVSKKERMEYLAKMIKCIPYIKQSIKEEKKLSNKDQNVKSLTLYQISGIEWQRRVRIRSIENSVLCVNVVIHHQSR